MNAWAAGGRYDCNFLCVCVLGDAAAYSLCREMSNQMKLTHCVNGYIDNDEDMPTYGQLGCKGFIILDEEHRVASGGTSAFMQVRDLAFEHVEAILDAVCARKPLPQVCPGEYLVLARPPPDLIGMKGAQGLCLKVDGSSLQFGFMSGPLRGRAAVLPVDAVSKLTAGGAVATGGGGGCSDGKCGPGGCAPKAGGCGPGGCGPGGCGPGACGDGGCAPGSCGPGGCAPGACGEGGCTPGSCGPGRCEPGACAPGGGGCKPGACGPGGGCGTGVADCGQGACDGGGACDGTGRCLDDAFVASALDLVSVKVPSMDAEHAECAQALRELATTRTYSALEAVLEVLSEHFAHEEELFMQYNFGAHANEQLSARKSHMEEHQRILDKIRGPLAAAAASPVPSKGVAPAFVRELLQEFHEHTTRYDSQYAEPLSAKGAQ